MDPYQQQQLMIQAESAARQLISSLETFSNTIGLSMFREIWNAATPEQKASLVEVYMESAKKQIAASNGWGMAPTIQQVIHESGVLKGPEAIEALRGATIARAVKLIENSDGYSAASDGRRDIYQAIYVAVGRVVEEIATEICRLKREQIAEAVVAQLADKVIDSAVQLHA